MVHEHKEQNWLNTVSLSIRGRRRPGGGADLHPGRHDPVRRRAVHRRPGFADRGFSGQMAQAASRHRHRGHAARGHGRACAGLSPDRAGHYDDCLDRRRVQRQLREHGQQDHRDRRVHLSEGGDRSPSWRRTTQGPCLRRRRPMPSSRSRRSRGRWCCTRWSRRPARPRLWRCKPPSQSPGRRPQRTQHAGRHRGRIAEEDAANRHPADRQGPEELHLQHRDQCVRHDPRTDLEHALRDHFRALSAAGPQSVHHPFPGLFGRGAERSESTSASRS